MAKERLNNSKILYASIWNFIGTFLLKAIAFISVPILTRIMDPSDYGLVSTYATYISFLGIFIGLSLNTASTNARIDHADRYSDYNSSIMKASMLIFCVEVIIANSIFPFVESFLGINRLYLNIVFIIAYAEYIVNTYYKINAVDFKFKQNLKISVTNAVSSIVLSILFITQFKNAVFARLLGQGLFICMTSVIIYYLISFKRSKCFEMSDIKYAMKIALPNIFHMASSMVMSQSDRIFILNIYGSISVAKYSVVYNFGLIMQMVWNAINEVWVPWLYRALYDENNDLIIKMSKIYIYIFTYLTSIAMIFTPDCMIAFAPKSYLEAKSIIPPVVLATYFIFLYSFFVNIEIYNKKNRYIAIATSVAALINIIGNAFFIPIYGYKAAAYTTLVSYVVLTVMHYFFLTFLFKKNIYELNMFIISTGYMILISIFVGKFIDSIIIRYLALFMIVVFGGVWGYKNMNKINDFIKSIRR